MSKLATSALFVAAAGLMATLAWEVGAFAPPDHTAVARPRAAVAAAPLAAVLDHTGAWVSTILARPLLSPDRRPPSVASAAAGAGVSDSLPRLSGVLVGPFGRSAIFAADGAKPIVVGEGGRINAWTVRLIEAGEVQVTGPGGSRTMHPSFQDSPAAPGRPATSGQRIGLSLAR